MIARLTWYTSNIFVLRKTSSWSNFNESSVSSFLASRITLNENNASMPLARTLSYIRKTTSSGNLDAL